MPLSIELTIGLVTWFFFGHKLQDEDDRDKASLLCSVVILNKNITLHSLKETPAYTMCLYSLPSNLTSDSYLQSLIDYCKEQLYVMM